MIKINLPATMKIETLGKDVRFTPYKENFVVPVKAGTSLSLKAETVGQYLYYVKQGFTADDTVADITPVEEVITEPVAEINHNYKYFW